MYAFEFEVTGKTRFPLDMLRYDRCSPLGVEDSWSIRTAGPGEMNTVRLIRYGRTGAEAKRVTVDRWASFGWYIREADWDTFPLKKLPA